MVLVEAVQDKSISDEETGVAVRLAGTLGGVVVAVTATQSKRLSAVVFMT
jgi:hypothetical protein